VEWKQDDFDQIWSDAELHRTDDAFVAVNNKANDVVCWGQKLQGGQCPVGLSGPDWRTAEVHAQKDHVVAVDARIPRVAFAGPHGVGNLDVRHCHGDDGLHCHGELPPNHRRRRHTHQTWDHDHIFA
jgi:hypothetical protein